MENTRRLLNADRHHLTSFSYSISEVLEKIPLDNEAKVFFSSNEGKLCTDDITSRIILSSSSSLTKCSRRVKWVTPALLGRKKRGESSVAREISENASLLFAKGGKSSTEKCEFPLGSSLSRQYTSREKDL